MGPLGSGSQAYQGVGVAEAAGTSSSLASGATWAPGAQEEWAPVQDTLEPRRASALQAGVTARCVPACPGAHLLAETSQVTFKGYCCFGRFPQGQGPLPAFSCPQEGQLGPGSEEGLASACPAVAEPANLCLGVQKAGRGQLPTHSVPTRPPMPPRVPRDVRLCLSQFSIPPVPSA